MSELDAPIIVVELIWPICLKNGTQGTLLHRTEYMEGG